MIVSNEEFLKAYGDINASTKELTQEQKDNRNIIYRVTNKYRKYFDKEELLTFGLNAMWRTLQSHIEGKGNKFTTSLWTFTQWECNRQYKNKIKKKNTIVTVPIKNLDMEAAAPNPDAEFLREKLAKLPELDIAVLTEYYLQGYTMQEIGDKHGYSKEAARQKIKKALAKLNKICKDG